MTLKINTTMKKWKNKIIRRTRYYDKGWDAEVAECQRNGVPLMCKRAYRSDGFSDGAEWMLDEVLHLLRQKKYKCDKLIRESAPKDEKFLPIFAATIYSRIIKELTE